MRKFRHSSWGQRFAIGMIAVFAVLFQSFLAPSRAAFLSDEGVSCGIRASDPSPTGGEPHQHGQCCIVACAACGVAYVAAASGLVEFPIRQAAQIGFDEAHGFRALSVRELYFGARGPPQTL
jgi:hypothetical protein